VLDAVLKCMANRGNVAQGMPGKQDLEHIVIFGQHGPAHNTALSKGSLAHKDMMGTVVVPAWKNMLFWLRE
jgi:hypothetical protein